MKSYRQHLLLVFTLLSTLLFNATFSPQLFAGASGDALSRIQKSGEIKIAVSIMPPWVMQSKKGELIGFEIDIAKQLAKDIGVKPVFIQYQWKKMIPALKKGEVDIIVSGLSITPKRALEINFSEPYASSGYRLVTNLKLTKDFSSIEDLNNEKTYITAVKGTVSVSLTSKIFPKATLDLRKSEKEASAAVINGVVHAFIAPSPIPELISLKHSDKVDLPLKNPLLTTREAFAINKGEQEMLNFLNSWIVAHDADEWIESSHEYWFNSLKWQRQVDDVH